MAIRAGQCYLIAFRQSHRKSGTQLLRNCWKPYVSLALIDVCSMLFIKETKQGAYQYHHLL